MRRFPFYTGRKQYMKRKLFLYMLILVMLILLILFSGLQVTGRFTGEKQKTYETLNFQTEIFSKQVSSHFERLAAMGLRLSTDTTDAIEAYLAQNDLEFSDINNSEPRVVAVQEAIFELLKRSLLEADCSGAFILLEATVNTSTTAAESSRTGLYLQRSSIDYSDNGILLFRGLPALGKKHGIMPHRKWRQEIDTGLFPNYAELIQSAERPLSDAYRISDIFTLAGTSERAMLLTIPILGEDGTVYGLCGFEISESYFKYTFHQPSELERAIFTINKGTEVNIHPEYSFSCGITDGYYLSPNGNYESSYFGSGLTLFRGENAAYIGEAQQIHLCKTNGSFILTTLIPKQDYDHWILNDIIQIFLIIMIVISAMIGCSYFFSQRYLSPIKKVLEQLKRKEYDRYSGIAEIDDLFAFLAEQDRIREQEFDKMHKEHADTRASLETMQNLHNETVQHVERLAYSRREEIDPDDYEAFKIGLRNLTEREKEIFDLYIAGNNVKEIMARTKLKESTIRFHNKNIYSKLGIHSLKQLLRYSAIQKQEESEAKD